MKKLKDLLSECQLVDKITRGNLDSVQTIQGITSDSRQVAAGDIFVAVRGGSNDGHQFLPELTKKNPAVFIVENDQLVPDEFSGIVVKVENTKKILSQLASEVFDRPTAKMLSVGVTGTNGKTSITYLVECILNACGLQTGVIGTVNHHLLQKVWPSNMTTPDPVDLQKRLGEMRNAGASALAIEVSSHALDQYRVEGIQFDVAIFTNLTRDHLDYHKTMEGYLAAKSRFFTELLAHSPKRSPTAIINIDDPVGRQIAEVCTSKKITYGQANADLNFKVLNMDFASTEFQIDFKGQVTTVHFPMSGLHNVYNASAAMGAALAQGIELKRIAKALESFEGVPGRLQQVRNNKNVFVFVDYAHSPDALENVLSSLQKVRGQNKNEIWTVFGCGGDRDTGKRPQMAAVAERLSDQVMVTSDNPRTEDPLKIIDQIVSGFSTNRYQTAVDRKSAIQMVLRQAKSGDVVLIAGKGHEDYQIIGDKKMPFSDVEIVREFYEVNK